MGKEEMEEEEEKTTTVEEVVGQGKNVYGEGGETADA